MKISVVVPVYNSEKYLCRCLDSIVNQTYEDWEVIAIDDGSKDNSYSILLDYSSKDKRFKACSQENQGPGLTRNRALELVTGDYVVFIDSDDYVETAYFEDLAACVSKNGSDVVFIDVVQESPDGEFIKHDMMSKYKDSPKDAIIRHQMTGKMPWGGCRKAVRTSLIMDNGMRYSKDAVGEEALFSFRVLHAADRVSFIEKPHYHYVNHPTSQSKMGDEDPWGAACEKIGDYLKKNDLYEKYSRTLNSFGFAAFIVSAYRKAQKYGFAEAVEKSKEALKTFEKKYGFDLDKDSLESRVRCMLPFAKHGMISLVVVIAKIKSMKKFK